MGHPTGRLAAAGILARLIGARKPPPTALRLRCLGGGRMTLQNAYWVHKFQKTHLQRIISTLEVQLYFRDSNAFYRFYGVNDVTNRIFTHPQRTTSPSEIHSMVEMRFTGSTAQGALQNPSLESRNPEKQIRSELSGYLKFWLIFSTQMRFTTPQVWNVNNIRKSLFGLHKTSNTHRLRAVSLFKIQIYFWSSNAFHRFYNVNDVTKRLSIVHDARKTHPHRTISIY